MRIQNLHMDDKNINWPIMNPTQWEFVTSKAKFLCLSGGYGSGKTTALVWKAIMLSTESEEFGNLRGNVGLVGRLRTTDFEKTTLPELLRWLPRSWIKHIWRKDGILELRNGSIMHFTHFDSIEHLQSYNIGFAGIDQMEQVDWDVFKAVAYERIRLKSLNRINENGGMIIPKFDGKGLCISTDPIEIDSVLNHQCVFGACNPRRGWIYKKFVMNAKLLESPLEQIRDKHNPDFKIIYSSTYENQSNLPPGYIERQKRDKSTREFARSVIGSWDVFEGQVFSDFADELILENNMIPRPSWDLYIGIDHGGTGYDETRATGVTSVTFGALEHIPSRWDKIHIFDELYLQASTIEETCKEISIKLKNLRTMQKYHYDIIDESDYASVKCWRIGHDAYRGIQDASESIAERYMRYMRLLGIPMALAPASIDERERIERVNWIFRKSLCTVNPKCIEYINSHRSVVYGRNEKIKLLLDDHATESGGFMMSALPMWHQKFTLPEQKMSLVDKELAAMSQHTEMDDIYGGRYANA